MNAPRHWLLKQLCLVTPLAVGVSLASAVWADETSPNAIEPPVPVMGTEAAGAFPDHGAEEPVATLVADHNASKKPADCNCEACQAKQAEAAKKLQAAVAGAYKGAFYDNNFDYLCNPAYDDWHLGENLKRLCIGDLGVLDVGGEYRLRYHDEQNMRGLGLTGNDDYFLLQRTRVYMNGQVGERFRVYAEYIDAESNNENFTPRPIEVNRSDMLNLFGDWTVLDNDDHGKLIARIGRQELLYGDQRLISPLDWANTRRTFDGGKLMWTREDWRVDAFWTRPVIVNPVKFDSPDENQQFYGAYSTYSGRKNHTYDFYWLGYQSDIPLFPGEQRFAMQTAGTRWAATHGPWLTLFEGGYQFGTYGTGDHSAGFFTLGGGHKWEDAAWKPTLWAYYDWASGDPELGNGFNQLFPLGHKYFGFMDFYARSNIQDINFQLTANPHKKLTALLWYHIFLLQNTSDVPYHVTGRPVVTTAGGDRSLGQEIDLLFTYAITPRAEIQLGYSHFFTGEWYRTNPVARNGFQGDADFLYSQFQLRF